MKKYKIFNDIPVLLDAFLKINKIKKSDNINRVKSLYYNQPYKIFYYNDSMAYEYISYALGIFDMEKWRIFVTKNSIEFKVFIRYLKEHNLYNKYINSSKKYGYKINDIYSKFLSNPFPWRFADTDEGWEYWCNLEHEWEIFTDKVDACTKEYNLTPFGLIKYQIKYNFNKLINLFSRKKYEKYK